MSSNPEIPIRKKISNRSFTKTIAVVLIMLQLIGLFGLSGRAWADSVAFAGGTGTQDDPWLIETAEQLDSIRTHLYSNGHPDQVGYYYKLIADIDLDVEPYNQGAGWVAFGTTGTPFTGVFDGNGHTISNMEINLQNDSSKTRNGLFGATKTATIRNLGLENSYVNSNSNFAGSLIGEANDTSISQVYATGSVSARSFAGGLVGIASGTVSIADSYFIGTVEAGEVVAAGLVAYAENSPLNVDRSYAVAVVKANVAATAGGLIGGTGTGAITASYYDQDVSGMSDTGKGEPTASSAMRQQQTYNGWNFADSGVWSIDESKNDGYPYLNYQHFTEERMTWTDITGEAIFNRPLGIAVDSFGSMYVVNYQSYKINKLVNGATEWTNITGSESFKSPTGVAVDNAGNVYVADRGNRKIKKLSSGTSEWLDITGAENMYPNGLAVTSSGDVYVADSSGKIKKLASGETNWTDITGTESFASTYGIAIDGAGNMYVADINKRKIKKLPSGANKWMDITTTGNFTSPAAITVDNIGNVYVADGATNKIKRLKNGAVRWENITGSESFLTPFGIATDRFNNVYVTDLEHSKIKKLSMTPAASPSGGIVTSGTTVTLTMGIGGATIYYTTDGTEPTINNGTVYSSPIPVTNGMTIKAFGVKKGMTDSVVMTETYTIKQQTEKPAASPAGGAVAPDTTVALTSPTVGATIYYTTDGTAPTSENGTIYVEPIPVTDGMTINAIALKQGLNDSEVMTESYTITQQAGKPAASPAGGAVAPDTTVTLTSPTGGTTIYFTTDGTAPSIDNGTIYVEPIPVTDGMTINAIAVKQGLNDSELMTESYTITQQTGKPAASPAGGAVAPDTTVTLTSPTGGATIYYTTDGTAPSIDNGTIYVEPIPVTDGMTINAIAVKQGLNDSELMTESYMITQQAGKPAASPTGGTVASGTTVTLTTPTNEATIYFTTNGTTPSIDNGTIYNAPIPVTDGLTIKAVAVKKGMTNSEVMTETYTIKQPNVEPGGNSSGGSTGGAPAAPSTPVAPVVPNNKEGFRVLVEGKEQVGIASASSSKENGKTKLTVKVDTDKLAAQLAKTEDKPVIIIPVTSKEDNVSTVLTGDAIKQLENKHAVLEIRTPAGNYQLPAAEVSIDQLATKLGREVKLADITLHVDITANDSAKNALMNNEAGKKGFTVIVPPVDFMITASNEGKTVEVNKFNSYVVREIALSDNADLSKITTAVVLDENGVIRHVPTYVTTRDGKHYAVVNSLTNSTYSLIWHPMTFVDVESHWAKDAVEDMASRMVINGVDATHYNPDAAITRAEFAAIMVRALGLPDQTGSAPFNDVSSSDWYVGAVAQAQQYGIIQGYEDDMFHPSQTITREEALVILERAMRITGLEAKLPAATVDDALPIFKDAQHISPWANSAIAKGLQAGIITGRATEEFAPKASITRAEVAVIIQRLMTKSGLI
ncbi:chitobiase/beta-hexosaminidase C-terminal domain-containing protein [Paenibacillus sp. ClWae2A]|uniref:chitobiase/beta-hexosaminidase C-terminal domain-containing protein n=1 Tax=Paenibacillus sp. ClWae2A TaxID=3057177 RepID=UPI0028F532FE|nr:chitobiase/beta-hexosaminidase C-terminal domain-containing protein [Paenibacillus sp. ClWae2A]MDT9722113.1 chitobiase/beta-hexosaminidase C-terminal domain-containing protein [Paenibacillus sp. ClWae2A]